MTQKKLSLRRETLQNLTPTEASAANGGLTPVFTIFTGASVYYCTSRNGCMTLYTCGNQGCASENCGIAPPAGGQP